MRVAAVYSLPFHRWILEDTVQALRALGVEVPELVHEPDGHHDWAQNNGGLLANLRALQPDALLMADYPYAPFRDAAGGCPVFATRHSLAARGNTWAPEQAEADYLAVFGDWDEALLDERGANLPPSKRLRVGCPWAGPLLAAEPNCGACWRCDPDYRLFRVCQKCGNKRCPHVQNHHRACSGSNEPGQVGSGYGRPIVAWAPTWNDWSPDIAEELAGLRDAHVVYRPHYATAWRNPAALDRARVLGFEIDDPLQHPANLLLQADVLVGDVSGIVLLALAVPGARLPIVQVDPTPGTGGTQIEKWGPEWVHRRGIGSSVLPGEVADLVREIARYGEPRESLLERLAVRARLFGADPLPGGLTPGQRLAREIVARVG